MQISINNESLTYLRGLEVAELTLSNVCQFLVNLDCSLRCLLIKY